MLGNPEIGGFRVDVVSNAEERELRRVLARFFSGRRPDDLLFLHVSCHGVKDAHGDLYLAAADTELDLLSATGVSAAWLNEQLSRTRSRRTVVLLDCCFSGSFPFGTRARAGGEVSVPEQFEGHGRGLAVITASSSMEYAYEGDILSGEGQPSYFTDAVVAALETGEADRDQDHLISVQELYDFVFDRVKKTTPSQTPNIKSELQGPLYIARSSYQAPIEPRKVDAELLLLTESLVTGARLGAVEELEALLGSGDPGTVLAARQTLERMRDDDSRRVSAAAEAALAPLVEEEARRKAEEDKARRRAEEDKARRKAEEDKARRKADTRGPAKPKRSTPASQTERTAEPVQPPSSSTKPVVGTFATGQPTKPRTRKRTPLSVWIQQQDTLVGVIVLVAILVAIFVAAGLSADTR